MPASEPPRELRVCGLRGVDGLARYQIGYWRRYGTLLVQVGTPVVVEDRDLVPLVQGIADARRMLRAVKGIQSP